MEIEKTQYCVLMRGEFDCKEQEYWSAHAVKTYGKCDPYWTTYMDENSELKDVLYIIESFRYNKV